MHRKNQLVTGKSALAEMRALQRAGRSGAPGAGSLLRRQPAFDAAAASGLSWLNSQLELINPNPVEPLMAQTAFRDLPMRTGGGFPEFLSSYATDYASSGGGFFGLQGTNNTEIPEAQVNVNKTQWGAYLWASGFTVTYFDMRRWEFAERSGMPAPFSWQSLFNKSVDVIWNKAIDYVAYLGWLGGYGLCNNPNAPAAVAAYNGNSTKWAQKSPTDILIDINFGLNQTVINSGFDFARGCADRLLLPYSQYAALTLPMTIGGIGYQSTIDYVQKNCVATKYGIKFEIEPLPDPWIATQGLGGTARGVFYRKNEDDIVLPIPQPKEKGMTVPTTDKGGAYQTFYVGCIGQVQFLRTQTCFYLDNI